MLGEKLPVISLKRPDYAYKNIIIYLLPVIYQVFIVCNATQ